MNDIKNIFVDKNLGIQDIISLMSSSGHYKYPKGIVLVVDQNDALLGTITDGDIRRAFNKSKNILAKDIMNSNPLYFSSDISFEKIIDEIPKKLQARGNTSRQFLSKIILVNKNNIPVRLISYHELWQKQNIDNKKVTVVGLGYVGLTLSLALADSGLMIYGKKDELVPLEYITELNKRLSAQKGIKVEFRSVANANHFFSKNETHLTKNLNEYIKKETALY